MRSKCQNHKSYPRLRPLTWIKGCAVVACVYIYVYIIGIPSSARETAAQHVLYVMRQCGLDQLLGFGFYLQRSCLQVSYIILHVEQYYNVLALILNIIAIIACILSSDYFITKVYGANIYTSLKLSDLYATLFLTGGLLTYRVIKKQSSSAKAHT